MTDSNSSPPKSPTDPVFTAKQDGKLPSTSTPFHLARHVSDIGALAQGGSDIGPTARSARHARMDFGRRESQASADINSIHDTEKNNAMNHDYSNSTGIDDNHIAANYSLKDSYHNPSAPSKDIAFRVDTTEKNKEDTKKSTAVPELNSPSSPKNAAVSDNSAEDPLSHNKLSQAPSVPHSSSKPSHFWHLPRRPSSSASLEDLVEKELKGIFSHIHEKEKHFHKAGSESSKSDSLKDTSKNSDSASTISTQTTSSSNTHDSTNSNSQSSSDANEPPSFPRRCFWIPPESGNPSKDNAVEDARARWFSHENFKDLMYSKLHNGTGPSGPGGTGVPSGTSTPI